VRPARRLLHSARARTQGRMPDSNSEHDQDHARGEVNARLSAASHVRATVDLILAVRGRVVTAPGDCRGTSPSGVRRARILHENLQSSVPRMMALAIVK